MILLLIGSDVFSQEIYQQTHIELDEVLNENESYECQATTSIKLLPGFQYKPNKTNSLNLEIDRYSVFPPCDGYYGGVTNEDDGVVGTLPGSFNISSTGAAVYSIDLKLPNAIGTMMPKISFVYNSQSSNGIMGWAWGISGLSVVERVGQTEYHDSQVTNVDFKNDRFVIDGQRLMLVNGIYGADKAEYKTEIDNFDKIVSYANSNKSPESFMVWKNDGTIWEYGTTNDSRIETQNDNGIILKWLLCKISDRNGNSIVFNYDKSPKEGTSYINNIEYTKNETAGLSPAYKILFVYDTKHTDVSMSYVYGNAVTSNRILKNVVVVNNYTGKELYNYSFEYHQPGMYGRNYYIHYRLKSVGLAIGNDKINPTHIIWNSEKHYQNHNGNFQLYQLDKSTFSNVTFVGDFNGDGFSDVLMVPYKIQDTYPEDIKGDVYLNNGNGTFQNNPTMSVVLSKNLEWIYVIDLNGDAIDDIVTYEINYDTNTQSEFLTKTQFYIVERGNIVKKECFTYENNIVVVPGKFIDNDRNAVVVVDVFDGEPNDKNASYIYCKDDKIYKSELKGSDVVNGIDASILSLDVSGDGISELLALKEDGYDIYKVDKGRSLEHLVHGTSLTKDIYVFPNDFNGDGKTDILYYDSSQCWKMTFSDGRNFVDSKLCLNTTLLNSLYLNQKDRYRYSLRELEKPSVTIRTADFDGDGCADVGVFKNMAGNYYLEVGLSPYVKPNNTIGFADVNRYRMPINYSHQTILLGRFLAQENVSILSGLPRKPISSQKAYIASLYPHSAFYSVERIVDGMGNIRGVSYDYLMCKNESDEKFYSCDNVTINDIKRTSIPVAAVKTDTTFNVNDKPVINKYQYYNALIHSDGHGFLGFGKIVARNYVNGALIRKQVREYECNTMGAYSMCLPSSLKIFHGEQQIIKENRYSYCKYSCTSNNKIVVPLIKQDYEVDYNLDKHNEVLKVTVSQNDYLSDNYTITTYDKLIRHEYTSRGVTDDCQINHPYDCQYMTDTYITYDDDVSNWVINRPREIFNYHYDKTGEIIGNTRIFVYDKINPLRVIKETKIPNINSDYTDSLLVETSYDYDMFGNMISKTMSSPSVEHPKTIRYEYGEEYQYRYRTKTIDEQGREIDCNYDMNYGLLISTEDYNEFETKSIEQASGVTTLLEMPDGMKKAKAIRWAKANDYAPYGASYYVWEKSTGQAESMVFYHKSGVELRNVTFDINGDVIFIDVSYDDFGNVKQKTLPYSEGDEKIFVKNVYDCFNRLVEVIYPSNVVKRNMYDGNVVCTEMFSNDGKRHRVTNKYNVMNWLVEAVDAGGNKIKYEYFCDGLIKYAQIGDNAKTQISVTYDNCRNRTSLNDPNYGLTTYEYDAWGNVKKIKNPKNGVIELQYDMSGRLVGKIEKDDNGKNVNTTRWLYNPEKGKNGLLNKIISSNDHQIEYIYDENLRLVESKEMIQGECYSTLYNYDDANRLSSITYPSGLCVVKKYSNSGYEKEIIDASDNIVLWRTNDMDAKGHIVDFQYGNGIDTKISYDVKTSYINNITVVNKKEVIQNLDYLYDGFGNMVSRIKSTGNYMEESFEYDNYDRLVGIRLNGKETAKIHYDTYGNIMRKEVNGIDVFYDAIYDFNRPNMVVKAKSDDENMFSGFRQNMTYSLFDNLLSVSNGDNFAEISYGCDNNRIVMKTHVDGMMKTKTYVNDCEFVEHDGRKYVNTFINGPNGVFAICVIDNDGNKSYNYVHKDYVGSWNIITDENSKIVQKVSYDAWGNIRDYDDWNIGLAGKTMLFDKGFTGHECLSDFGLVNMNGRFYDPMMSMMLSPDNNIQMPQLSQNFNRYSYCLNNPLKYNDPTGECVESVVFGIIGGAANVLYNADAIDSFGEFGLLFGVGFVKGFLTEYTMGQSWLVQVGVQTIVGGMVSGVNQMVSIGDGSFELSGDDWNSVKTAAHYGLGSSLVKSFMNSYFDAPTDSYYGDKMIDIYYNEELGHAITSLAAHGMGCWFSGQPFLQTLDFEDVGFDLKMLGCIANRMLASYVEECGFAEDVVRQRAQEIKNSVLADIRSEDPEYPDFECIYDVDSARVNDGRLYIVSDIFALLPGEMLDIYPKPYMCEIVSFPFSFSLFKTLFFYNQ